MNCNAFRLIFYAEKGDRVARRGLPSYFNIINECNRNVYN